MKIITLNTWGSSGLYEKRWVRLMDELDKLSPDILCLQEVFEPSLVQKLEGRYRFSVALATEPGLAVLSNYPLLSFKNITYKTKSPLEDYDRGSLLAILEINTEPILIANTHLSWKPVDQQSRLGQVDELIEAVRNENLPSLLTGDFNDSPDSEPIKRVVESDFCDLFTLDNSDSNAITWDNRNPYMKEHAVQLPDRRIDFIFANRPLLEVHPIASCDIVFNQPDKHGIFSSDHYGVFAELED